MRREIVGRIVSSSNANEKPSRLLADQRPLQNVGKGKVLSQWPPGALDCVHVVWEQQCAKSFAYCFSTLKTGFFIFCLVRPLQVVQQTAAWFTSLRQAYGPAYSACPGAEKLLKRCLVTGEGSLLAKLEAAFLSRGVARRTLSSEWFAVCTKPFQEEYSFLDNERQI